jgi:hypothetical protein
MNGVGGKAVNEWLSVAMLRRLILLIGLFVCSVQNAYAKIDETRQFQTLWFVEGAPLSMGQVSTPPGKLIFKQRLLPLGVAILDIEFSGLTPDLAVPAGTELIKAIGPRGALYCSTAYKEPSFLASALLGSGGPDQLKQVCFYDADEDGRFEQAFRGYTQLPTLPSASGLLPKKPKIIDPVAYHKVEPSTFKQFYYVGIQYAGQSKIGSLRRFHLSFGTDSALGSLSDNIFTKRDSDLPAKIEVMGAVVTVRGGEGRNVLATIDRMFPSQPFGVIVTTIRY